MFATHYHALTAEFATDALVRLQRMAYCADPNG